MAIILSKRALLSQSLTQRCLFINHFPEGFYSLLVLRIEKNGRKSVHELN